VRITVRLESYSGFYFVGSAMQPVEPGAVVVEAFGDIVYMSKMVDYQALHDELDRISKNRTLAHVTGGCDMSQGKQRSFIEVEFTISGRDCLVPLPNEEALIEWLSWCGDNLFEPHSLRAAITYMDGEKETYHYHVYDDAFERIKSGEVWQTTDPNGLFSRRYGIKSAEWLLVTTDGIVSTGVYVAPEPLAEELFDIEEVL
jgi:hypothetical protein